MEWGGVGLLPFLLSEKTRGHALKATFVTEGFPIHHLTMENSSSIASRAWAVSMFKLRAKNKMFTTKRSQNWQKKKKTSFPVLSYLCLPIVPAIQTTRKDEHANSVANVCDR